MIIIRIIVVIIIIIKITTIKMWRSVNNSSAVDDLDRNIP